MLVMVWVPCAFGTAEPLYVSVHVDRTVDAGRVLANIYGQVTGANQSVVALAAVSIQVNDPYESTVHIAFLHSDNNGEYSDAFQLPINRATGNYTIYVTATKPGFQDAQAKLTFLVGIPSFSISISPASVAVTRGESATFRITLGSRGQSSSPVHIEVIGLPALVSYSLDHNNETAPSNITLSVKTSNEVDLGSYLFTVIGTSVEGQSEAKAEIVVKESDRLAYYVEAAFLVAAVLLIALFYKRRKIVRKLPSPPSPSTEYLEGLALSPSTLLSLPDHLRKTAIIVCELKEASANEVAARSGRARAAESDYLNQLSRMGILKKKRKGRESYFSVG
jgi:hypothetical protein